MENDDLLQKLTTLQVKFDNIQDTYAEDIKNLYKKYEELDKRTNNSDINIQRILLMVENTNKAIETQVKDIESIKNSITELQQKPAKKWDNVSMNILLMIITAVIGVVFGKIGLN